MDTTDFTEDQKAFAYQQFARAIEIDEDPLRYFGRLISKYLNADAGWWHDLEGDEYREIVDSVLTHVCGFSLETIIDKTRAGEQIDD